MAVVVKKGKKKEVTEEIDTKREKLSTTDQIRELEEKISKTKYNKKTQFAIGQMKAKLAKLREKASGGGGGGGAGFAVKKSGDGTVVLLGFPSVGKSTLMNKLTGTKSETGAYAFTTLGVIPGTVKYKGATIQILDVPGIVKGAAAGSGRGKEVLAVLRSADLVLMLIDCLHEAHLKVLEKEVFDAGLRLDKKKPDVRIKKKDRGGVSVASTVRLTKLETSTIKQILKEFSISNADVVIRDDIDADDLIDVITGNRVYTKSTIVLSKIDLASKEKLLELKKKYGIEMGVSAESNINIEKLKEFLFQKLKFIRIFTKERGKKPDMDEPLILMDGSTIEDVCRKLHKDFVKKFKYSKIWGPSAKFPGQTKMLDHIVKDGDIVEITTN